ncbi:o-succinylbenzoate synthase [Psychrobacillus vulpis]|uniref:o-succinylbenzoate synthase n=1 Tax=Psychrobacillus vulpis TaxID=2325572 RepID=A0A544TVI3_9BACI|nr:o-succinylbenzoate synthase [Psychrobacillus vulpis]TQR21436.1 o-succinylbenzoate synthase [Psychrobacillus vulpis]
MLIEKVVIRKMKMDLKFPFQTSFGTLQERLFLITEIYSGDHVGYGECVVSSNPYYSEETVSTAFSIIKEFLLPLILGKDVQHPDDVNKLFSRIRRNNMAKSAIEGALWDLYAKTQNKSLAEVIGGQKSEITVGVSIGIQETKEDLLNKVEESLKQGFKKIKIKIMPGKDIEYLRSVREKFGDIPVMADANSAYTLDDIELFKEMDDLNLIMIEQPLAHDDIVDHAVLQNAIKTPICLDESIHSVEDARKAIELGSCKIINIKIGRVGGISESIKIHNLCLQNNIPVWCGGMLESGIGRAHNVAITSLSNFTIPGDTAPSTRYWVKDIIKPEITMNEEGHIQVPTTPGMGYEVDLDTLEEFTLETNEFTIDSLIPSN